MAETASLTSRKNNRGFECQSPYEYTSLFVPHTLEGLIQDGASQSSAKPTIIRYYVIATRSTAQQLKSHLWVIKIFFKAYDPLRT